MFDIDPFTESTSEQVLDYIEQELLGNKEPFDIYQQNRMTELTTNLFRDTQELMASYSKSLIKLDLSSHK